MEKNKRRDNYHGSSKSKTRKELSSYHSTFAIFTPISELENALDFVSAFTNIIEKGKKTKDLL